MVKVVIEAEKIEKREIRTNKTWLGYSKYVVVLLLAITTLLDILLK